MRLGLRLPRPWRRAGTTAAAYRNADAASLEFDAVIDVPGVAAEEVRTRVGALPGAAWISVEPALSVSLTVYRRGSAVQPTGAAWDRLRGMIRDVMDAVLASPPASLGSVAGFAEPSPGFGDAATVSPALQQLAAIAALHRPPAPEMVEKPAADPETEHLAQLLGFVLPVDSTAVAQAAVQRFGSYAAVLAAPETELRRVPGLGQHSIAAIKLMHAAAIRLARDAVASRPVLESRDQLADYLAAALARERIEQFRILFLNGEGMLQADEVQARGTVNHTPVYPREVVRRALALGAASLILVHNHPSGDPTPSREDIEMTRQVQEAAAVLKIELRDHVIVGNGRWLSFRDEGLLDTSRR